jgi:hypothetical protein
MNNPDHIFYNLETIFLGKMMRDPGFRDKHPGSATLLYFSGVVVRDTHESTLI